jgi:hypothetical protein
MQAARSGEGRAARQFRNQPIGTMETRSTSQGGRKHARFERAEGDGDHQSIGYIRISKQPFQVVLVRRQSAHERPQ